MSDDQQGAFLQDLAGLGKLASAIAGTVRAFLEMRDLKPCNTRIVKIKASPSARFRRRKIAVHRDHNGKFDIANLDPSPPV